MQVSMGLIFETFRIKLRQVHKILLLNNIYGTLYRIGRLRSQSLEMVIRSALQGLLKCNHTFKTEFNIQDI